MNSDQQERLKIKEITTKRAANLYLCPPGGKLDILTEFCMDHFIVPADCNTNCLCSLINGHSHQGYTNCKHPIPQKIGTWWDHVSYFRNFIGCNPKRILCAVSQPYFQGLEHSQLVEKTLEEWCRGRGIRVIWRDPPYVSWWNPGTEDEPKLGQCCRVEFWFGEKGK
jgi:hypothetical protein